MAMEGSDYGSAHMPSPALVVFSQAANGLSEALRIQRPFHSQVCTEKNKNHNKTNKKKIEKENYLKIPTKIIKKLFITSI